MKMKIKGLDVDYEINGSGNNILILHGWGSSKEVHRDMINSLSKHNKVYALDFPGFGKSEEPKTGWNVDDYVELIIKFIEKNNIKNGGFNNERTGNLSCRYRHVYRRHGKHGPRH